MYEVIITERNKKTKKSDVKTFVLGTMDTPEYDAVMDAVSEYLYAMDLEYDEVDGDGDMAIDDMLIAISEEEDFEKQMQGRHRDYRIVGVNAE